MTICSTIVVMKDVNAINASPFPQPLIPQRYRQCTIVPFLHLVAYMDLQTCDKRGPVFDMKVKLSYQIMRNGKQSSLMFLDHFNQQYSLGVPLFPLLFLFKFIYPNVMHVHIKIL